ncbi:hypothetical protein [Comamonas sp. JC664]|uniref:hypothetical protein n=1 Tax=Comamonas sp. JC664 TaxID=2801917 RepID=UPI00174BFC32|nr:hypothetical protein [Comamonas sp. JC664]MBL0697346.1 hypothetical protein [Comamonas sp. JC664]GHG67187.1 hypothetical protein GCM10012319_09340 [Comamonas sp. KCTC 72670]
MESYWQAEMQLRQCLKASAYQRGFAALGLYDQPSPNFPDTHRYTISQEDFEQLAKYFKGLQSDLEFSSVYPKEEFRFEVASSGSTQGVMDLKISPISGLGSSGKTIFNYHIGVA